MELLSFSTDGLNTRCYRFVRYEGCTVALAVELVGLMMLIRISALYAEQKWITRSLGVVLLIETGVNIWLISGAQRASFPSLRLGGLLIFPAQRSRIVQIQAYMV